MKLRGSLGSWHLSRWGLALAGLGAGWRQVAAVVPMTRSARPVASRSACPALRALVPARAVATAFSAAKPTVPNGGAAAAPPPAKAPHRVRRQGRLVQPGRRQGRRARNRWHVRNRGHRRDRGNGQRHRHPHLHRCLIAHRRLLDRRGHLHRGRWLVRMLDRTSSLLTEHQALPPITTAAFDGEHLVVADAAKLTTYDAQLNEVVSSNLLEGCVSSVLLSGNLFVVRPRERLGPHPLDLRRHNGRPDRELRQVHVQRHPDAARPRPRRLRRRHDRLVPVGLSPLLARAQRRGRLRERIAVPRRLPRHERVRLQRLPRHPPRNRHRPAPEHLRVTVQPRGGAPSAANAS